MIGRFVVALLCDLSRRKWGYLVLDGICYDWSHRQGGVPGRDIRGSVVAGGKVQYSLLMFPS